MSAGYPIISNTSVSAREMLDEKTGIILKTNSENEVAENAICLLQDPQLRKEMSSNALKTKNTTLGKVGQKHAKLFYSILDAPILTPKESDLYIN
jgi:glycosyltransferase involved in cell wall biosynthesis